MLYSALARTRNQFCLWFLLIVGLTCLPAWSEGVYARIRVCRGDPIVVLSDKRVVRMTVEVEAAAEDVDVVVYTLRVPRGVKATQITYTGGELSSKEQIEIVADLSDPNAYTTTTLVKMGSAPRESGNAPVTVEATSQIGDLLQSVVGKSNKSITMKFNLPR